MKYVLSFARFIVQDKQGYGDLNNINDPGQNVTERISWEPHSNSMTQQSPEVRVKTDNAELVPTYRQVSQVNGISWYSSCVAGNGAA